MKTRIHLAVIVGFGLLVSGAAAQEINVVIVAGQNNHNWRKTTPELKKILEQSGDIRVDVVTDPEQLAQRNLTQYDVILSNWNNWQGKRKDNAADTGSKSWSEKLKTDYIGFVRNGGGHVVVHAGSSSFFDWADYQKICCATWKLGQTGHGRPHQFDVRMTAGKHPITQGVKDFQTKDELWRKPGVQPGVQVLAEAYSTATGHWEPTALATRFGEGRCFTLLLGHNTEYMRNPGFQTLLVRGVQWAAGRRPTAPSK